MSQIPPKKLEANTPGKDKSGQKTADFKAKHSGMMYKEAVMGRSKFGSKKGTQTSAIRD